MEKYDIVRALNSPLLYGSCLYSVEISRRIFQDLLEKGKGPYMLRVLEWWWVAIVFKKLLRVLMPAAAAAAKSHNANFAAVLPRACTSDDGSSTFGCCAARPTTAAPLKPVRCCDLPNDHRSCCNIILYLGNWRYLLLHLVKFYAFLNNKSCCFLSISHFLLITSRPSIISLRTLWLHTRKPFWRPLPGRSIV